MRKVRLVEDVRYFEPVRPVHRLLRNMDTTITKGKIVNVGNPVEMSWNHGSYLCVPCEFLGNRGFLLYDEVSISLVQKEAPKPIIYVAHAGAMNFKEELYKPIHASELNQKLDIHLPHEKSDEPYSTVEFLGTCDAIVAEVSFRSTGQGIELGQANMMNVPIVCIYRKGTSPAGSLKTISDILLEYEDSQDLIEKISQALTQLELL
jgi:hypothetical protein